MRTLFALIASSMLLFGCASSPHIMPEGDDSESQADGAAYTGYGMPSRKPMPERPQQRGDFFYKHCGINDDSMTFSANNYECTGP